ncbi:MAG: hypothetical protein AB7F09_20020 [Parvibaculaceae bacterium]
MSRKRKAAKSYRSAGYNEEGVARYIDGAEEKDRGTARYPWPVQLKRKILRGLDGLHTEEQMRDTLNKAVLDALGGGLHDAGPIDGGPHGRGPARGLGL